jgi:DNA-binding MarR family transcriptional regulator
MERLALARLLSAVTRIVVERMHAELAEAGHPGLRPAYGYAVFAVSRGDVTTSILAAELGMTKQGAAKLVATLEELGYLERRAHSHDARAQLLALTAHGDDLLRASARAQDQIEREWERLVGKQQIQSLRGTLEHVLEHRADDEHIALRPIW